jgi:DNA-binding MarR family transcriptional regulator
VVPPVGDSVDFNGLPLTALVARLSHVLVRELAAAYVDQGINAQPLDASLFVLLSTDGARLTALAERLNTSKQALTFVVARLERHGYLTRAADPNDKRAKRIELTESGHGVAAATDAALRRIERRWRTRAGRDWPQLRAGLAQIAAGGGVVPTGQHDFTKAAQGCESFSRPVSSPTVH